MASETTVVADEAREIAGHKLCKKSFLPLVQELAGKNRFFRAGSLGAPCYTDISG
jgi:hypothetical protein